MVQALRLEFKAAHCDVHLLDEEAGLLQPRGPNWFVRRVGWASWRSMAPALWLRLPVRNTCLLCRRCPGSRLPPGAPAHPVGAGGAPAGRGPRDRGVKPESQQADGFSKSDRRIVSAFAERAALALDHARLVEAERRRASQLSILYEFSREIAGALDPMAIYQKTQMRW